jgi:hypothetical protein
MLATVQFISHMPWDASPRSHAHTMLTYARIMQLVDTDSILSDSAWVASSLALTFALGIVFFYIALEVFFRYKMKLDARDKLPPTIPYMIPFLGNLWRYLQDPIHFIDSFT